jgi:hypothetical protein
MEIKSDLGPIDEHGILQECGLCWAYPALMVVGKPLLSVIGNKNCKIHKGYYSNASRRTPLSIGNSHQKY